MTRRKACMAGAAAWMGAWGAGLPAPAQARQLDRVLNTMMLDAHTEKRTEERTCGISAGGAVGQTFITGAGIEKVHRIELWQAFWHESWQPGENLVVTLWDSPAKRNVLGRTALPYSRRMWEGALPMPTLDAQVQEKTSYYFELTVETDPLQPAEVPRDWQLSRHRPPACGGDGAIDTFGIARADYPDGQAYVNGEPADFDLFFRVHGVPRLDRDRLYQRAFDRFDLEQPALAAVGDAVAAKDWDRAVTALVKHFESRVDLLNPQRERPVFDPTFDTREGDLAAEFKVLLEDGTSVDLGPHCDHARLWPERGGVGLTRGGLRKPLAAVYMHTGNDKYARAFNAMLEHYYVQHPSPVLAGVYGTEGQIPASLPYGLAGGSIWSALSIGARMLHGFHYYAIFADSPFFTEDMRAAWIINLGEMAEVLERMEGGGNWQTQMSDALFKFGELCPEFKKSKYWFKEGFDRLVANALSTVKPDGVLQEPTTNYHLLVLNRYSMALQKARALGLEVPAEMERIVERMFDFVLYSMLPDGTLPAWGDSNSPVTTDLLARGAELFNRPDFTFAATAGKEGTPPRLTSKDFPQGGFFTMRTGWTPQSHVMGLRCGPFGSHGHYDALSMVLSVFGRPLLIDPGVHTYGTREAGDLQSTPYHSTVSVDGDSAESASLLMWAASAGADVFGGRNLGYRGNRDIKHERWVWCLKPLPGEGDAATRWLVFDRVFGPGRHALDLRYRFGPMVVEINPAEHWAASTGDGGNLLIAWPADTRGTLTQQSRIAVWEKLLETPMVSLAHETDLPAAQASVLVPFRGADRPSVRVHRLKVEGSEQALGLWIEQADRAIMAVLAMPEGDLPDATHLSVGSPAGTKLEVAGQAAVVRLVKDSSGWQPRAIHAVRAKQVHWAGQTLWQGDRTEWVDQTRQPLRTP